MTTSRTEDFFAGLQTHLAASVTGLTADKIFPGFPDDRIVKLATEGKPTAAVSLILSPDPENRTSGKLFNVTANLDNTATLEYPPLPFRLTVYIHTFALAHFIDWQMGEEIQRLLESGKPITTPAAETYYPRLEPGDNQDDLTADGFAKVYRFSVPLWLADARAAETEYLVLHTIFDINDEILTVPEEE
ncbi:hypothetical protein M0R72_07875 [Candidatus Pacearchaeota archaeon]|jgi:hypothetical protein|nr:hypothetical protein [Candidatus Pacearchaeota archaeon]